MGLQVLAQLPWLRSLNLRGCPVSGRGDYPGAVLALLPDLDILDNKRRADHLKGKAARAAHDAPADKVERKISAPKAGATRLPGHASGVQQPKAMRHAQRGGEGPPPAEIQSKGKVSRAPAEAISLKGETGKVGGKRRAGPDELLPASAKAPKKARAAAGGGRAAAEAVASRTAGEQHLGAERSLPFADKAEQEGGINDSMGAVDLAVPQPTSALVGVYEPRTQKRGKKKQQQSSVARGAQVCQA